jgi:antirestriction protein ArdC
MSVIDKLRTTFLMAHEEEARNEYTYVFPADIPSELVPSLSAVANALFTGGKVNWRYGKAMGEDSPGYNAGEDRIYLFTPMQYPDALHYTNTLLHELVHWSGHPLRLGRFTQDARGIGHEMWEEGTEEMTAQLGAALLLEQEGLFSPSMEEHTARYVKGWATQSFDHRPECDDAEDFARVLFGETASETTMHKTFDKAAQQAQAAVAYLKGLVA